MTHADRARLIETFVATQRGLVPPEHHQTFDFLSHATEVAQRDQLRALALEARAAWVLAVEDQITAVTTREDRQRVAARNPPPWPL